MYTYEIDVTNFNQDERYYINESVNYDNDSELVISDLIHGWLETDKAKQARISIIEKRIAACVQKKKEKGAGYERIYDAAIKNLRQEIKDIKTGRR